MEPSLLEQEFLLKYDAPIVISENDLDVIQ